MNFLQKILLKPLIKSVGFRDPLAFQRAFEDYLNINGKGEDYIGTLYAALDTWGLYFAKAKFRVYETNENGVAEVKNSPFSLLFTNPNPYATWWEMAYKIAAHFGVFGNSYIYKVRKGKNIIGYQQLIPSLVERKDQFSDYTYNNKRIPKEDMIEFRYPNPYKEAEGLPIISTIADQAEVNRLQMAYTKKFYEKGGFLGLVFTTDMELTTASFNRVKKMLTENYEGIENASKIGLFDRGLKPHPAAYSLKDSDLGSQSQLNRENILSAFKVSKILIGLGESINRATAEASIYQFTSGVIDPLLDYIDQVLTRHIQADYGREFMVRHDTLAPKDQEGKLKYYENGLKQGWLNINEVRAEEGWNAMDGALADIGLINGGGALFRVDTGKQIGSEDKVKKIKTKSKDDEDLLNLRWKQFNRRFINAERRFNRAITGYMDSQRRRILEAVKDNFIVEGVFNLEEENEILWQLLEIEIYSIMEEGYKYGAFQYDISPTLNRALMADDFNSIAKNTLKINSTTQEGLLKATNEEEINSVYENRADTISETTTLGAFNASLLQSMRDAGIENKIWLSRRDGGVRRPEGTHTEDHVSVDGVKIGLDDVFVVPSRHGEDRMLYPGDATASAENLINCRCTIIGA